MKRIIAVLMIALLIMGFTLPAGAVSLRLGDKNSTVSALQTALKGKGYYFGAITGYYGTVTRDCVKGFQRENGLTVDGVAGESVLKALNIKTDGTSPTTPSTDKMIFRSDYANSLGLSDEGPLVENLQRKLQTLGYFNAPRITNYYGQATADAVKKFQKAKGLQADGVAGPNTLAKLGLPAVKRSGQAPETNTTYKMTLRFSDENAEVKKLQQRLIALGYLKTKATGLYGTLTKSAVISFQQTNGLKVDGVAGPGTQNKLYSSSAKKYGSTPTGQTTEQLTTADKIIAYSKNYLGKPYIYGANGPNSFDCTGFTCFVFNHYGYKLPRSAYQQGYNNYGVKITSIASLKKGDLVFFNTISDSDKSDHAGIYLGGGQFIHASSSSSGRYVRINTLSSGYYNSHFTWARRVIK